MTNKIVIAVELILAVTAIVLLLISMFGNVASNLPLTIALGCVGTCGVINIIIMIKDRNRKAS